MCFASGRGSCGTFGWFASLAMGLIAPGISLDHCAAQDQPAAKSSTPLNDEVVQQMRTRVLQMQVRFVAGSTTTPADLHVTPLIHYSDQVRNLPESALWMWQQDGVPALFCKTERLIAKRDGAVTWQYCCVPAAEAKADVTWKGGLQWSSKEIGFQWNPLADSAPPHEFEGIRLTQLRAFARAFIAEISGPAEAGRQQSRLLPRPLHRFAAPKVNVLDGAVFGMTSNGTNPDVLIIVEALAKPSKNQFWRYAVVGLTGDAATVKLKDQTVWSKPYTNGPGDHKSWVWYLSAK